MELFIDNDILLKLSSADLLHHINKIFNVADNSIFILPTAKYYIAGSRKVKQKYSAEVIEKTLKAVERYSVIPDEYIDKNKFISLSDIANIDSGEKLLYSLTPPSADFKILTGDKVSIEKLFTEPGITETVVYLKNKIVCLEHILLLILEQENFGEILMRIKDSCWCGDKAVELVFSQTNINIKSAKEGLKSYYNDLNAKTDFSLYREI